MFKLVGKEINANLVAQTILIWTYDGHVNSLPSDDTEQPVHLSSRIRNLAGHVKKASGLQIRVCNYFIFISLINFLLLAT